MPRLVLQNWTPAAKLRVEWPQEEKRVLSVLRTIEGLSIVSLEPGSGLVEYHDQRRGAADRIKRQIQSELPGWKVYEETSYSLPSVV